MKKIKCMTLLIALLIAFTAGASTEQELKEPPLAVSIVFDAASSNRPNWPNLHSLARQTVFSLKAGDYFELISADQWGNHIRAAQFIKAGSTIEVDNLVSILQRIELPLIADTRLMAAVELALDRMNKFTSENPHIEPVIIVLTDGRITSDESTLARELAEKARNKNWGLYFTGTSATNRRILIDSSNGIIKWSLLEDATPGLWMRQHRLAVHEKFLAVKAKENSLKADSKTTGILNKKSETSTPALNKSGSSYEVKNEVVSKVSISENKNLVPTVKPVEKQSSVRPVTTFEKSDPASKKPVPTRHSRKDKTSGYSYLWWLVPLLIVLLSISGLWLFSVKYTKQWRERISKHLKAVNAKKMGAILAKFNGRVYALGKFEHFPTVHIGSGPNNTIRIYDKNIADRHLMITRKADKLWLKNLSKTSLNINGIAVRPSDWHTLILPSIVTLNENVSIKFELHKSLIIANKDKEKSDGTEKNLQPAGHSGNN